MAFEIIRNHRVATGLACFAGLLATFNVIGPLDDIKDDALSGGGDFVGGRYTAQAYFVDLDRKLFGGNRVYQCRGQMLTLDDEVLDLARTYGADNGQTYKKVERIDKGFSPACRDRILTDSDAKYRFWRD